MTDAVLPPQVRRWSWIPPVLAVRAALALALFLGSIAAVQEISIDCSDRTVYLTSDTGVFLTGNGKLLVADRGRRQCELRVGTLRGPLPDWLQ
jgi:hypothetical protein